MTASYWLTTATSFLQSKGIQTARLDALIILEDMLHLDRAKLLAEPDLEIADGAVQALQNVLNRRGRHEPLAYIRGHTEFYGRDFKVSPAVLVPRPESETMIELLKSLSDLPATPRIADVGTGSGALGITAALELPNAKVELLEIDPGAAEVAKRNVTFHTTGVPVIISNLLSSAAPDYDVLLCNLPYVPDEYAINEAATHEPRLALFAGRDGLDLYRELFDQINSLQKKPLFILTESLPDQHAAVIDLATSAGYRIAQSQDFIQVFQLQ